MKRLVYASMFSLLFLFIYGCGPRPVDSINEAPQIQQQTLSNKHLKKYYSLSSSGNILEEMYINLKGSTQNYLLNLNISASSYKNIFSGGQIGKYSFQLSTENKAFSETQYITGTLKVLSLKNTYFAKIENISFSGSKGKVSNMEMENKITNLTDKWIKFDKEIPFTKTLKTLQAVQMFLTKTSENNEIQNIIGEKEELTINLENTIIPFKSIHTSSGVFLISQNGSIKTQKQSDKLNTTLIGQKNKIILSAKIKETKKSLIVDFRGKTIYNELSKLSPEIKLDIKGKYTIKSTGYMQIALPANYLYFTQTPLSPK